MQGQKKELGMFVVNDHRKHFCHQTKSKGALALNLDSGET